MSATENRKLIEEIFAGLEKGDGGPFVRSLAEDFSWTIIGSTPWSGTYSGKKEVRRRLLDPLFAQFAGQYVNRLVGMIAEGDRVAVECRGHVTTKEGKTYANTYCWVCRIENGKLKEILEYMDTAHLGEALQPPQIAA
jgi:hypothetical protein